MVNTLVVIPARIKSSRLKEKPLADIRGKSLIERVWENACVIKNACRVVVATDSPKVARIIRSAGGECVMTPAGLSSGSDRVSFAVEKFYPDCKIAVNLQGDELFLDTRVVEEMISMAASENADLFSAYTTVSPEEARESSSVKVVVAVSGEALYFSRSLIPFGAEEYKKHLGIYVWRADSLKKFHSSEKSYLERCESLEQLRALEIGMRIKMLECRQDSVGVDTPEDLRRARERMKSEY